MGPDAGARRFTGFLQLVLAGGLAPAGKARAVAWKVLLGCHAPHGSLEDWQGEKEAAAAELARLRGLLAGDGAEARAAFQAGGSKEDWDRCAQRIRNDVPRTEPAGDAFMTAEVRARMVALLEAYALADPEVGYCQGMGDVLAVLLRIYDDDADAFMTFKALVGKRMRQQFLVGADDLLKPLTAAVQLVEAVDPRLHGALEAADGLPGMYMFQALLLLLRRELSAEDTLALWEKLFALQCLVKAETPGDKGPGYPDVRPNLAAALLLYMRGHIIGKAKVNADLVKMFNVLPLKLEVGTLLDILLSQFPLGAGEAKHVFADRAAHLLKDFAQEDGRAILSMKFAKADFLTEDGVEVALLEDHDQNAWIAFKGRDGHNWRRGYKSEQGRLVWLPARWAGTVCPLNLVRALEKVWHCVEKHLSSKARPLVYCVGHSVGGAYAQLCALRIHAQFPALHDKIEVCTFGAPPVGNGVFKMAFDKKILHAFRFVHSGDAVPSLGGYTHTKGGLYIVGDKVSEGFARFSFLALFRCFVCLGGPLAGASSMLFYREKLREALRVAQRAQKSDPLRSAPSWMKVS